MLFESLESRQLKSVSLSGGVLTVNGTAGDDKINVNATSPTAITVTLNGAKTTLSSASVKQIVLNGLGGGDLLQITDNITKPAILNGGDGNDYLRGGGGNDTLNGGNGLDGMEGNGGSDQFFGGAGSDTVSYASYTAAVNVSLDNVAGDGKAGENDNVHADVENITGGFGSDTLTGNSSVNVIVGGAGNDVIFGLGGNDILTDYDGSDTIHGGDGDDTIRTYDGPDTLFGDAGNDHFFPGQGADQVWGGTGTDTVDYSDLSSGVTARILDPDNDGTSGFGDTKTAHSDVENLIGTMYNDVLIGNDLPNQIEGWGGNDYLYGYGGNDNLYGGTGSDHLDDGDGDDSVNGEAGDDTFLTGVQAQGNDIYRGGTGTDTITYYARNAGVSVFLDGVAQDGAANEFDNVMPDVENVSGSNYDDFIVGSSANNVLTGNWGNDFLIGGDGNDSFDDGLGSDTCYGQGGDDAFLCGTSVNGADYYSGGTGVDLVTYAARHAGVTASLSGSSSGWSGREDLIDSDVENLYGTRFNDILSGNASSNTIFGYSGNDYIEGWGGADQIFGDDGNDEIWLDLPLPESYCDGGNGIDNVFASLHHITSVQSGTFANVEAIDWIDLP